MRNWNDWNARRVWSGQAAGTNSVVAQLRKERKCPAQEINWEHQRDGCKGALLVVDVADDL